MILSIILKESLTDENHKNAITKVLATQQPLSNQVLNDLSELIDNTSYASQIAPRSKVDNQYMQIVEEPNKAKTKIITIKMNKSFFIFL